MAVAQVNPRFIASTGASRGRGRDRGRYHLLDEAQRKRIGYENTEPIAYEVFRSRVALQRAQ
jgi:hypothetical protein